jgi:hypothetical protein
MGTAGFAIFGVKRYPTPYCVSLANAGLIILWTTKFPGRATQDRLGASGSFHARLGAPRPENIQLAVKAAQE